MQGGDIAISCDRQILKAVLAAVPGDEKTAVTISGSSASNRFRLSYSGFDDLRTVMMTRVVTGITMRVK